MGTLFRFDDMGQENTFFRIGQISDIHLVAGKPEKDGLNSVESFERALSDAEKRNLDLLVFSGDLTEDSSKEEYDLFFKIVGNYSGSWCMIPGNHDNSEDLAKFSPFPLRVDGGEIFYRRTVNGFPFFFLDSSAGTISKRQLEWLKSESAKETGEIFLFAHHPPCLCGHLFMDSRYALRNWKEVGETLDGIGNLHSIFVGHYHSGMTIDRGAGQTVYVTPSTQMQLDPESSEFHILSRIPGWRLIEYSNGKLFTELRFLGEENFDKS